MESNKGNVVIQTLLETSIQLMYSKAHIPVGTNEGDIVGAIVGTKEGDTKGQGGREISYYNARILIEYKIGIIFQKHLSNRQHKRKERRKGNAETQTL